MEKQDTKGDSPKKCVCCQYSLNYAVKEAIQLKQYMEEVGTAQGEMLI